MTTLNELLSVLDNKRRVAGRNLSDLVSNPDEYMNQTAYNLRGTAQEMIQDPANFVGGGVGGVVKKFPMKMPTAETSPVMAKVVDLATRPRWSKGAVATKMPDGRFAVLVDGTPVWYEKTLKEAEDAARFTDVDFWRGEIGNWGSR